MQPDITRFCCEGGRLGRTSAAGHWRGGGWGGGRGRAAFVADVAGRSDSPPPPSHVLHSCLGCLQAAKIDALTDAATAAARRGLRPANAGAAAAADFALRNAAAIARAAEAVRATTLRSTPSSVEDPDRSFSRGSDSTAPSRACSDSTSSRLERDAGPTGPASESLGVTPFEVRAAPAAPHHGPAALSESPMDTTSGLEEPLGVAAMPGGVAAQAPDPGAAAAWPSLPPPTRPSQAPLGPPSGSTVAVSLKRAFKSLFASRHESPGLPESLPSTSIDAGGYGSSAVRTGPPQPEAFFAGDVGSVRVSGAARPIPVKAVVSASAPFQTPSRGSTSAGGGASAPPHGVFFHSASFSVEQRSPPMRSATERFSVGSVISPAVVIGE